jgi:hypothetical protein
VLLALADTCNLFMPQTMDGWESRRRRQPGHDWCIIKLGLPGTVRGVEIDTAFFTGNQVRSPSFASLFTEEAHAKQLSDLFSAHHDNSMFESFSLSTLFFFRSLRSLFGSQFFHGLFVYFLNLSSPTHPPM